MKLTPVHFLIPMKFTTRSSFLCALIGFAFTSAALPAADILANGDFAQGKAHWKGDGKDASSADMTDISAPLGSQSAVKGMLLKLKGDWTSISQIFNTRETKLTFSMTYKTTPDFSLSGGRPGPGGAPSPMNRPGGQLGFGGLQPILEKLVGFRLQGGGGPIRPNAALLVIADPAQNQVMYTWVPLPPASTEVQTTGTTIDGLMAHEEKTFYLAFPPGAGTITFQKLSLEK